MSDTPIDDVSDTALWVAVYRAKETERPDAIFHDRLAGKLAGEKGRLIESKMSDSQYVEWSVVVRTYIIDTFIQKLIEEGVDTVINLGAGLDTRPYRLKLPPQLRWIEIDFPQIIALKNTKLAGETPVCRLERISQDLSEERDRRALFAKLAGETNNALILTEGVTPYLSNESVASLARDLRSQKSFRHFIVDYFAPELVKHLRSSKRKREMRNAPFIFNPENWHEFYEGEGWRVREMQYIGEVCEKIGRPAPHPWWVKLLFATVVPEAKKLASKRMNGFAILEPTAIRQ